jgi:hypothetical protein
MEPESISSQAKEYSKTLLIFGNFGLILWILLGGIGCWLFNPIMGWLFLVSVFVLVFITLRRLGCSSCYYCKSCTMGFGKLSDLFFGSGYMVGVNSSLPLKIIFVYILLGVVPIAFLAFSIMQGFAVNKLAFLAVLMLLLFYSGSRRKSK